MKRILWVIFFLFVASCASAPVGSGYLQGVVDSETLCIAPGDTQKERKVKRVALKVIDAAQGEIKALDKEIKETKARARDWDFLVTIAGAVMALTGLFFLISYRGKKPHL